MSACARVPYVPRLGPLLCVFACLVVDAVAHPFLLHDCLCQCGRLDAAWGPTAAWRMFTG